ncbi:M20 family metallo-hydrolase [Virgibacillus xinjiangensis]|uniref:M20 family metallo-hydrolase n=1 Tax=Virgibacillus xinjiangensis TaxID=393090 RepID=A0ABV7CTV9_9BACI
MAENFQLEKKLMQVYDGSADRDGISGSRLAKRLGELSQIGRTEDNGSKRPGFSLEEKAAKDLVMDWMREAGLEVKQDGAGNVFGRLVGKNDSLPAVLSGSHVDSVPNGGHFDGPLGVLAALEVAQAWKDAGYQPEKPYEVVIFSDEEGSRFQGGFNGSEAMMGYIDLEEKKKLNDTEGRSFEEVLADVGLTPEGFLEAKRSPEEIDMFVEVHIEQGKRLEKENLPCGIVTGIAGPSFLELTFTGQAGHAGNTPMNDRQDPLVAASEFIYQVNQLPRKVSESAVATVGKMHVEPNGINVIPGKVTVFVDVRDIAENTRDTLLSQVEGLANSISGKHGIGLECEEKMRITPVPIEEETQQLLEKAVESNDIRPYRLPSGAGHDSMIIGTKLPIAMLFTKSKDGISHNPDEWSDLKDCVETVHVLKTFLESKVSGS